MKLIHQTFGLVVLYLVPFALFYGPVRHIQTQLGVYQAHAEEYIFDPEIPDVEIKIPETNYKVARLREMASLWQGTVLEKHTVRLLSMLLQEDGTLTAERRHDCLKGVCYGVGFMGHSICSRGTPLVSQAAGKSFKKYCSWMDGKSPLEQFEENYPGFSFDWRIQFSEYSLRMTQCIDSGRSVNACIQAWNSREVGRIDRVKRHEAFVRQSIDI